MAMLRKTLNNEIKCAKKTKKKTENEEIPQSWI